MIKKICIIFICVFIAVYTIGCKYNYESKKNNQLMNVNNSSDIDNLKLIDKNSVYKYDKPDEIVYMYVTVIKSRKKDLKNYIFGDLVNYEVGNSELPKLEAIFQEGDSNGPRESSTMLDSNAYIELRGNSSLKSKMKSFKIKLFDSSKLWRNQQIINLNKHSYDITKIRNKLSFDYFKKIPNITSLRTSFVNLKIKDLTSENNNKDFVNFGLYTQVEQPGKQFLENHELNKESNLYKAVSFEFKRDKEVIKNIDDKSYDKEKFESILKIKGYDNHQKLINMLDDVNNRNKDINSIIGKHFNKENYLTWLAANILMGNSDIITQNYYLYSPVNSKIWYFMPWDYDGAWDYYGQGERYKNKKRASSWRSGISNYWPNTLHKRFLKDKQNIEALTMKIEELQDIINESNTKKLMDSYYGVVSKFVYQLPDLYYMSGTVENFENEYKILPSTVKKNVKKYYQSIENPMPFFLGEAEKIENSYKFKWEKSYDLQGNKLIYTFELSSNPKFTDIIYKKDNISKNEIVINNIKSGEYYWKVMVEDDDNNFQIAYDDYKDEGGNKYFGLKKIIIK